MLVVSCSGPLIDRARRYAASVPKSNAAISPMLSACRAARPVDSPETAIESVYACVRRTRSSIKRSSWSRSGITLSRLSVSASATLPFRRAVAASRDATAHFSIITPISDQRARSVSLNAESARFTISVRAAVKRVSRAV